MQKTHVQLSAAMTLVVGIMVFLYKMAQLIGKIQSWAVLWNPPTVSEMLMTVVFGLAAVVAATVVDLPLLLKTFMPGIFGAIPLKSGDDPPGKD